MNNEKIFKIIYFFITCIIGAGIIALSAIFVSQAQQDIYFAWFGYVVFAFVMALVIFYITIVSILVYKDASKREMNAWMWTLIATYVPNLIGIILYVIARQGSGARCPNCGKMIQRNYKVCPYCGVETDVRCKVCNERVKPGWKVCPHCGNRL